MVVDLLRAVLADLQMEPWTTWPSRTACGGTTGCVAVCTWNVSPGFISAGTWHWTVWPSASTLMVSPGLTCVEIKFYGAFDRVAVSVLHRSTEPAQAPDTLVDFHARPTPSGTVTCTSFGTRDI